MLKSMTGYGSASLKQKGLVVKAEVRSVNHKFFYLKTNVPESISHHERTIEGMVRQFISRGTINLVVRLELPESVKLPEFNNKVIKYYHQKLKGLQRSLKLKNHVSLETILRLPGVMETNRPPAGLTWLWAPVQKTIKNSLVDLRRMRQREGTRLKNELKKILSWMNGLVKLIEYYQPRVVRNHAASLQKRIARLLQKNKITFDDHFQSNLTHEIAFFAQRSDITEEIHRLRSHIAEFNRSLGVETPIGKKLDFLTQEVLREVNTITAKANDARISLQAVNLKNTIEKIKEQVQNIE